MRIVHVVPSYLPAVRYGGPVFAIHGLARALVALGHQVSVHTTHMDGDGTLDVPLSKSVSMDGVQVHYHRVSASVPFARRIYYSPSLAAALASDVARADVVHAHSLFLHPVSAAARAAQAHRVPFVLAPRGMLVPELFAARSPIAKKLWLRLTGRRLLERAHAIHVTSELEANAVTAFGLSLPPIAVVPNGLTPPASVEAPRDPARVLFLGRLSWKKGLHELIEAMVHVPHAQLRLVGSDDEGMRDALERHAQRLGVSERVSIHEAVDETARWHELARASVFVLASRSENFANAVLEAMAMRCPVVVTPTVGLADTVRDARAGAVSEPNAADLARHIARILNAPQRAREMGQRGRDRVLERFTWPQVAEQMVRVYRCVERRRSRRAA